MKKKLTKLKLEEEVVNAVQNALKEKSVVVWNGHCLFVPFLIGNDSTECCQQLTCNKGQQIIGTINELSKKTRSTDLLVTVEAGNAKFFVHSNNIVIVRDITENAKQA